MSTGNTVDVKRGLREAAEFGVAAAIAMFLAGLVIGILLVLSSDPQNLAQTLTEYKLVKWVLPAVVLAFFGRNFVRSRRGKFGIQTPEQGAKYGALIVGGWLGVTLILSGLLSAVFQIPFDTETLVLRGVVLPIVFGGIGGYVEA